MRQADFDLLVELYLDEDLSPSQHRELLDAVQSDPERRAAFLAAVDQTLRFNAALRSADPGLCERVAYVLEKERDGGADMVRGVFERLDMTPAPAGRRLVSSPRVLVPLAACLALAAGALVFHAYMSGRPAPAPIASVVEAASGAAILRADRTIAAEAGTPLFEGDGIETSREQHVSFAYLGEDTRIRLEENSRIRIEPSEEGKQLHLARGAIEADVDRQPFPMAVLTPHARIMVLGTAFSVTAWHDATKLNVRDGRVRIGLADGADHKEVSGGSVAFVKAGLTRVLVPGRLIHTVPITGLPDDVTVTGIALADDGVWIHGSRAGRRDTMLARIDPATGMVVAQLETAGRFRPGSGITWEDDLLWGFARDGRALVGIDIETEEAARTVPLPAGETSSMRIFDIHGDAAWVRGRTRNELVRIDIESGAVRARIPCPFAIDRIVASEVAIYAGESGWNACKIDPGSGRVAYRFMCEAPSITGDMALDEHGQLWTIRGTEPSIHVFETE